jgi:hypothetical protein
MSKADSRALKLPQVNPYPPSGLPTLFEIWADRKDVKERLTRSFNAAFAAAEPLVIEVSGPVGSGKSHTLKHFKFLMEKGWDDTRVLPLYMDTPGYELLDFYNRFISTVQMERIVTALRNLQAAVVVSQSAELQKAFAEGKATGKIVEDTLSQARLFENVRRAIMGILNEMKPIRSGGSYSDYWGNLASALAFLVLGADWNFIATKWLTFGTIYKSEIQLLRDRDPSFNIYKASPAYIAYCIAGILSLICRQDKYDKVVLFIDEMEAISEGSKDAMTQLAECLRHLIDTQLPGLVLVMGFTTSAKAVFKEKTALTERIHTIVKLDPLKPEDAVEFASQYIEQSSGKQWKDLFGLEQMRIMNAATGGKTRQLTETLYIAYEIAKRIDPKEPKDFGVKAANEAVAEAKTRGII